MADQHHRHALEPRQTADDGQIVAVHAIAVQFMPIGENHRHVVERVGTLRMARQLRDLPGREIGKNTGGERPALRLQALDLFGDVDARVGAEEFELLDLRLELRDRLFKFQKIHRHEEVSSPRTSFRGPYTKYQPSRPTKRRQFIEQARASGAPTKRPPD